MKVTRAFVALNSRTTFEFRQKGFRVWGVFSECGFYHGEVVNGCTWLKSASSIRLNTYTVDGILDAARKLDR